MIHSNRREEIIEDANPYYLFCDGVPLPIAIRDGNQEALNFRDVWLACHTQENKDFCGYDPHTNNFEGYFVTAAPSIAGHNPREERNMNNSTNPVITKASAILDATEIAVIDGDIILSMNGGGACAVGRIEGHEIEHALRNGEEPDREWKSALEAALVPHALENVCWRELHEIWAFKEGSILLYPNGEIGHLESGLSLRESSCIALVSCPGPGQIDRSDYAEGWTKLNEDRTYTRDSDGIILSEEEMILEAIRDGDWSDFYDDLKEQFIESAVSFIL